MVRAISWPEPDVNALGRFLRELNAGRSIDCLPQGIHPCKVLGSEFLRFVDISFKLGSQLIVRFLDDFHLFDSNEVTLTSDLVTLQELLGEKGLSLNDSRTALGNVDHIDLPKEVDAMKRDLLRIRRHSVDISGEETELESVEMVRLSPEQVEYLVNLVGSPDLEESDAELVLVLLRDHASEVLPKMLDLLAKYPALTKSLYHFTN